MGSVLFKTYKDLDKSVLIQNVEDVRRYEIPSYTDYKCSYLNYKNKPRTEYLERIPVNSLKKQFDNKISHIDLKKLSIIHDIQPSNKSSKPTLSNHSLQDQSFRFRAIRLADEKYFPFHKGPQPLTNEQRKLVQLASIKEPSKETLVEIDGTPILRQDIQTLVGSNWLNDEIVNAYLSLIVKRSGNGKKVYAFNTFFYPKLRDSGYNSVKRWTRKVDIFSYNFILVPVHLGNHWCLAVINFIDRTISYYDSLCGLNQECCDILLDYLRNESLDKRKQDFDHENWIKIQAHLEDNIPRQTNFSDCGVFLCTYSEYVTRQAKFNFTQEHMPHFREKMIYEIMTNNILMN